MYFVISLLLLKSSFLMIFTIKVEKTCYIAADKRGTQAQQRFMQSWNWHDTFANFLISIIFKFNQNYTELLFMFCSLEDSKIKKKLKNMIKHTNFAVRKMLIIPDFLNDNWLFIFNIPFTLCMIINCLFSTFHSSLCMLIGCLPFAFQSLCTLIDCLLCQHSIAIMYAN